jgi:hypothetical protein
MSMHAVRIAFTDAAAGELRLDHAGLSYQGDRQVLSFTGWHADGTPFAMVTAAFDGNPVTRAGEVARDIIAAHAGPIQTLRSKIMSQKGSGLARLMGASRVSTPAPTRSPRASRPRWPTCRVRWRRPRRSSAMSRARSRICAP